MENHSKYLVYGKYSLIPDSGFALVKYSFRKRSHHVTWFLFLFFFLSFFVWCGPFLKSLFTFLDNGFCSSARDLTNTPCFGRQSLNPKITREVQVTWFFNPCVGHPYIYQASSITMRPSKKIGGASISTTEKGTRMRVGVDKEIQDADGSHPCSICKSLFSHPLSSWLREMFASGV